ncbi:Mitochondrial Rho GTPase [Quillaja saponaria]|uniref:Mitochondrial Rho GTPase n=1 Tax=Quillaja saponaria TaxID=32244 RepID=A0AAD7QAL5_QUISA|nr:Mitochondrial Rho GTPase [Quillaja saponaria]
MEKASARTGNPNGVRIVVAGDKGTGKSTLIITATSETFPTKAPPLLPPTRLPEDFFPDRVPITIIDTSSRNEDSVKVAEELKRSDAVVLTYACGRHETLDRLRTFWLPYLRQLEVKVPVIVVGCMLDLRDETLPLNLEHVMTPLMQDFQEIETCIECSAFKHIQVPEVFYYSQKAVLHPTAPLFDQETQTLKPRCVRALKRIFIDCDHDKDGVLSDAELNDFQVKCFNAPLQPSEIVEVKRAVQEKLPEGVNDRGLTLTGFLFLHALFIEKGRLETTWNVLRIFGYDNDIKLSDHLIPASFKRAPDQSLELTNEAIEFLKGIFDSPWIGPPFLDTAERNAFGGLSFDVFLTEWALMTLLDPAYTVENLIYIGYDGDASSATRVTRKRPESLGLLNSFLARPYAESYISTTEDRYAVNVVDLPGGSKKTLVLREIPEYGIGKLLSKKDSLAPCDIAVFVHDSFHCSSDECSWKRATELLVEVAGHGEESGFEVPCLIVAAKDDLDSFPMAIQDSTRVSQDMGIDAPIPISTKLGELNNIFRRIVTAAEHPHLSIPETEAGRSRKQHYRHINNSLVVVSVGAALAVVGLAAFRFYAARKNTSS